MSALIECVPNFSEGRDLESVRQITAPIEAAFRAIAAAAVLIVMTRHRGEHPRMGATDVCPLVPISGITLEETAACARRLAERVGRELGIPVYLYEAAQ